MTCKDRLKNDIIVKMRLYLDTTQMSVLEAVNSAGYQESGYNRAGEHYRPR